MASAMYCVNVYPRALPLTYSSTAFMLPEMTHPFIHVKQVSSLREKRFPNTEAVKPAYGHEWMAGT